MKNIVWLASYPKSGNTWFRIFLSNLQSETNNPIDINAINPKGIFSSNKIFELATGIHQDELTSDEADSLRPDIFRYYSQNSDELLFIKTHDAFTYLPNKVPIFPSDVSYGVIYFIRNPLDVAVSWAFHLGKGLGGADKRINNNLILANARNKYQSQLRQKLLTWKANYRSWTQQKAIPIIVLRYEDMKQEPLKTFKQAIQFLKWDYSDKEILLAIENSSFKNLQSQEQHKGFKERVSSQKAFFRKGTVGDWKNHLTHQQVQNIVHFNRDIMKELNYI